jgi:hypothetical protein
MPVPGHVLLLGQLREIRRLSSQIAALALSCELKAVAEAAQRLCQAPEKTVTAEVYALCALARSV